MLCYNTFVIVQWGILPKYYLFMCFTVTSSFWLRPSSFLVIPLYWGGATSSQINSLWSIWVCHLMWGSASIYPPSEPYIYSFHTFTNSYQVGKSMVVGHILMVHTCSLMCTNHIDMMAHTQAFLKCWGTLWWSCFFTCVSTVPEGTWTPNAVMSCLVKCA